MAIISADDYIKAVKQRIPLNRTTTRTSVANIMFGVFDVAGNPGAGTLNAGNTANGTVPTDAVNGYPVILPFGGTNGHLSKVEFYNSVASDLFLYDVLFAAGAYTFNADVTLASQPDFSGRLPGGSYAGLELWIEAVTAFTGNQTVEVNYLDQDGNAGDTGAIATGVAPIAGRMFQLPLAAGDYGISQITRVRSSVSTVGTFNVYIMRPLWSNRVPAVNSGGIDNFLDTGLPEVFADSAIRTFILPDGTSTGLPRIVAEISNN